MANEETVISSKLEFSESGIDKVNKKVDTLGKSLSTVADLADVIVKKFNELQNVNINVHGALSSNHSKINFGKNRSFEYRNTQTDKDQLKEYDEYIKASIKANKDLDKATEKLKNAQEELTKVIIEEKKKYTDDIMARKAKNADTAALAAENRKRYLDSQKNYLKYRDEHPEEFGSQRKSWRYQMGRAISSVGNVAKGAGTLGAVAGIGLEVVGSALISPAMVARAAIVGLGKAISSFSKSAVESYAEIESIRTNLSVVYSSQTQADTAFSELSQYAVKSPFGVQQTSELAILLKQSGVYASDLMDTLKMLGDTAGGNMEKMKRIANNYAQIVSIGKASMLDMRQFAYAGIPIFEAVSKELNVSQQELRKLISDGKVTADIIEKVFKDLTGVNGIFENATAKGAETLKARLQNLKDAKQLMLSEFGEFGVNIGTKYGNDSLVKRGVTLAEDIFQGLQKWVDGKNLKNEINTIANNKSRIEELKMLIDYAEKQGDTTAAEALKEELEKVSSVFDIDKERAIYESSYQNKQRDFIDLYNKYGNTKLKTGWNGEEMDFQRVLGNKKYAKKALRYQSSYLDWLYEKSDVTNNTLSQEERQDLLKQIEETQLLIKILKDTKKAVKKSNSITEEERRYHRETLTLNAQQDIYDTVNKFEGKNGSIFNISSEIRQAMSKTPEAQAKALEEQKSSWAKTIETVTRIAKATDKIGNVDITKLTRNELLDFINSGAFSASKLNVVEGKNASQMKQDREILTAQYDYISSEIKKELKARGETQLLTEFKEMQRSYNQVAENDEEFYRNFDTTFSAQNELFTKALSTATPEQEEFYKKILTLLGSSTLRLNTDTSIVGANVDELLNKTGDQFVPLWKRILSSATGVSTTAITGTKQTLDFYANNLSTRNNVGSTLAAMAREGLGVDAIQRLTSSRLTTSKLKGDSDNVWQIDWEATRKNVGNFAKALSASTTAIDTWTNGLENEYNTYADLVSSGILSPETDNVKSAMYISAKKLDKSWISEGEMGVNAFGEQLVNEEGEVVSSIKDGIAYNKQGVALQNQNLLITGNIYTELKKHMASVVGELKEARIAQAKNSVLSNLQSGSITNTIAMNSLKGKDSTFTNFFSQYGEEYIKMFEANLNTSGYKNKEELYTEYLSGNSAAVSRVNDAIISTNNTLQEFLDSDIFKTLKDVSDSNEHLGNVLSEYDKYRSLLSGESNTPLIGYNSNSKSPYHQRGLAGFEHRVLAGDLLTYAGFEGNASISELANQSRNEEAYRKGMQELEQKLFDAQEKVAFYKDIIEQDKAHKNTTSGTSDNLQQAEKELSLVEKEVEAYKRKEEQLLRTTIAQEVMNKSLKEMSVNMEKLATTTASDMFLSPFKTLGENMDKVATGAYDWSMYLEDAKSGLKAIAGQMLGNLGNEMATAGLRIAAAGALEGPAGWGKVAAGLSLAAAGGVASGLGSMLTSSQKNNDNDGTEKLKSLAEDLQKLLDQARSDALYYENNLRHKTALGINKQFSNKSVNDAIIAPNGNIITTAPDDYLIATKTPGALANNQNVTVQPKINFTVIDNSTSGAKVAVEQQQNSDGSIDFIAKVYDAMDNYIATSRSDDAFAARQYRINGRQAIR